MSKDKFITHEGEMHEITNDDLTCKDCIKRFSSVSSCADYHDTKPGKVLYGGECELKVKELPI